MGDEMDISQVIFVDDLPEDLVCCVCYEPSLTLRETACGHVLCKICFTKLPNNQCPLRCPTPLKSKFEDLMYVPTRMRRLNKLTVLCACEPRGCQWRGCLSDFLTRVYDE
eukprot:GHVN01102457.1.p2 GENE.GHVN01102457.1~~GHVN01102457.1.p2  ORF type:complete len:110 (-),score=8.50 GHVN01102457.1:655-984(-)